MVQVLLPVGHCNFSKRNHIITNYAHSSANTYSMFQSGIPKQFSFWKWFTWCGEWLCFADFIFICMIIRLYFEFEYFTANLLKYQCGSTMCNLTH